MTLRLAAALTVAFHAVPGLAQFEGTADLRTIVGVEGKKKMEGTGRLYLTARAWRMETEMKVPEGASPEMRQALGGAEKVRTVVFGKLAEPRKSWTLNERTKTYAVHEANPDERGARSAEEWTVTRAGRDTVAGLACENVKAQRKAQDEVLEACLAPDFLSGAWMRVLEKDRSEGWLGAAQRAGARGYPVRMISRGKDGAERFRMEIVKLERRRDLPASLFEVPAGYRETSAMGAMAQTPEQQRQMEEAQKKMNEALKNMSPEQRKAVEGLMRRQGRTPP